MGTRADFYIGLDENAIWLGSTAWDGYPSSFKKELRVRSRVAFLKAVKEIFAGRDDVSRPENGWPWPWKTSQLTNYAYTYDPKTRNVYYSEYHLQAANGEAEKQRLKETNQYEVPRVWVKLNQSHKEKTPEQLDQLPFTRFPNMSNVQKVTLGGQRSGIMLVGITDV